MTIDDLQVLSKLEETLEKIPQVEKISCMTFGYTIENGKITGLGVFGKLKFRKIPEIIFELTNLKHLGLGNNGFYGLPERLEEFRNLEWLCLKGNGMEEINDIGKLTNLEELHLDHNYLEFNIHTDILKLQNLKYVDLSFNCPNSNDIVKKLETKGCKVIC